MVDSNCEPVMPATSPCGPKPYRRRILGFCSPQHGRKSSSVKVDPSTLSVRIEQRCRRCCTAIHRGGQPMTSASPVSASAREQRCLGGGQNHFSGLWPPPLDRALLGHLLLQIASA